MNDSLAYFHLSVLTEKPGRLTFSVVVKCGKSQSCITMIRSLTRMNEARKPRDSSGTKQGVSDGWHWGVQGHGWK